MTPKAMRAELKENGLKTPRSNEDLLDAYIQYKSGSEPKTEPKTDSKVLSVVPKENEYTYIGQGDTPPQMINFMGKQIFLRGEKTTVIDSELIDKIKNNPSFVKGDFSREDLMESDKKWAKHAKNTREEHVKMEIEMQRKNRKHG